MKVFNNFLSEELLLELKKLIETIYENGEKLTTNRGWSKELLINSVPILRYQFDENDIIIFDKLKKEIENKIDYHISTGVIHFFPNLSHIPWHDDHSYQAALTIYLNEHWDENWGGFLLYKEDNIIKGIKPTYNLGVLQTGNIDHCVTTTNINAKDRISLQFFLTKQKKLF